MPVDAPLAEAWVREFTASVTAARDELTRLDQAIGDGDHGANLSRGLTAATDGLSGDTPADVLKLVGRTLISKVGGASGPLYGTAFREVAKGLGDAAEAAKAAASGTEATIPMQARKGRASYLGPRSVGHQDPGATSSTMLFAALAKVAAG